MRLPARDFSNYLLCMMIPDEKNLEELHKSGELIHGMTFTLLDNRKRTKGREAAYLHAYYLEAGATMGSRTFFDVCDDYSEELSDLADYLCTHRGQAQDKFLDFAESLLYVDRFYLEPEFRSQRAVCGVLERVFRTMTEMRFPVHCCVVNAFPVDKITTGDYFLFEDPEEQAERFGLLVSLGFERVSFDAAYCYQRLAPEW